MISNEARALIESKANEMCVTPIEKMYFLEGAHFASPIVERETWREFINYAASKEHDARIRVKHFPDWLTFDPDKERRAYRIPDFGLLFGSIAIMLIVGFWMALK